MLGLSLLVAIAALYVGVPAIAGLDETWTRLSAGDPAWLLAALSLEVLSFASYMVFFRTVFVGPPARIGWAASYRITMAGVAATRVLAVAGVGGIVLTAWALRRMGLRRREVASEMAAFYVLLYGLYMAALVVFGLGLYVGVFAGPAPRGLTLVPAAFGGLVAIAVLGVAAASEDLGSVLARFASEGRETGRVRRILVAMPATISSGVQGGMVLLRAHRPGLLGAVGWWGFDIAVLGACLQAFGSSPPLAVIVMAYFVGMLANTLPVPGGIGAVEGGMIAALIGFGVDTGPAIVGVLSYRAFSFWLPIVPGVISYLQLLHRRESVAATEVADPDGV